jgi:site-specific DNA-adenine methylase
MPEHTHYWEAFFGGAVLFIKPPGASELVNGLDGSLTNFWQAQQGDNAKFIRRVQNVRFSEVEFRHVRDNLPLLVDAGPLDGAIVPGTA